MPREHHMTDAERCAAARLAAIGMTTEEISKILGRTSRSIRRALVRKEPVSRFETVSLQIERMPRAVHRLLSDAARRRAMPLETLILEICAGVVLKGSIHKAISGFDQSDIWRAASRVPAEFNVAG